MTQDATTGEVSVSLTVHVAYPPTSGQLLIIEDKLKKAARMVCDATDGQVLLDTIKLERTGDSSWNADVLWYPNSQITKYISDGGSYFGADLGHFRVADDVEFRTVGHELSHLLFGLYDQYDRQNKNGGECGIGPAIQVSDMTPANHTLMQEYYTVCVDANNNEKPMPESNSSCADDDECVVLFGANHTCTEFSSLASEFSTPFSFETRLGRHDPDPYLGTYSGTHLWVDGIIDADIPFGGGEGVIALAEFKEYNGFQKIKYIDQMGDFESGELPGSLHYIYLTMERDNWNPHVYWMRAYLNPTLQAGQTTIDWADQQALLWTVNGSGVGFLELEFSATSGGCSSTVAQTHPDYTQLISVNGQPIGNLSLTLKLPATKLAQNHEVPENFVYGDAELQVDVTKLCENLVSNPTARVNLADYVQDPETGLGTGTFIGSDQGAGGGKLQQVGNCTESSYQLGWYAPTQRWETSDQYRKIREHWLGKCNDPNPPDGCEVLGDLDGSNEFVGGSDWQQMVYNLQYNWPSKTTEFAPMILVPPASLPDPDPWGTLRTSNTPYDCRTFVPMIDNSKIDAVDTIAMLVDRSTSMGESWHDGGSTEKTKYEWARAGAVGFATQGAADFSALGTSMDVTVMFYQLLQHIGQYTGYLQGTPPPGAGLSPDQMNSMFNDFEPYGLTGTGFAIKHAYEDILTNQSAANGVFLFTDGGWDVASGLDEDYPWDVPTIEEAVSMVEAAGVPIFISVIGVGDQAHPDDYFALAGAANGAVFPAYEPDLVPSNLVEMRARMRGEDLSIAYARSDLSHDIQGLQSYVDYPVWVESGADHLELLITPKEWDVDFWMVQFEISGPGGESITNTDQEHVTVDENGLTRLVRIDSPTPGLWQVHLEVPDLNFGFPVKQSQTVMAHVSHDSLEDPRCRVGLGASVIDSVNAEQEVLVEADWLGRVGEGALFSGQVRRPDGSLAPLQFEVQDSGLAKATISDLPHDGIYQVLVDCDVEPGATYAAHDLEGQDEGVYKNQQVPGAFERTGVAAFGVSAGLPVVGRTGMVCSRSWTDSDGDGLPDRCDEDVDNDDLPNSLEGGGDLDGDGIPNNGDHDSDNDGEMDGIDIDPHDELSYLRNLFADFNGDGVPDRVKAFPDYSSSQGRVLVKLSGSGGADQYWTQNSLGILDSSENGDEFGSSIIAADFNGDGYDDLAVGVPGEDYAMYADAGAVNVLYGSPSGLTESGDQIWREGTSGVKGVMEAGDGFGARLNAGDFNCDGYADLVIGVPQEAVGAAQEAGSVHVLYGTGGGLTSVGDLWYQGDSGVNGSSEAGDRFGDTLATGDFDGDTCDDLVIGAPTEDWGNVVDAGNAYAMYGAAEGLTTVGDWTVIQGVLQHVVEAGDLFASRLWAIDRDRDGYSDLVVMSPGDPCGAGWKGFNSVFGGSQGLSTTNNTWVCLEHVN